MCASLSGGFKRVKNSMTKIEIFNPPKSGIFPCAICARSHLNFCPGGRQHVRGSFLRNSPESHYDFFPPSRVLSEGVGGTLCRGTNTTLPKAGFFGGFLLAVTAAHKNRTPISTPICMYGFWGIYRVRGLSRTLYIYYTPLWGSIFVTRR